MANNMRMFFVNPVDFCIGQRKYLKLKTLDYSTRTGRLWNNLARQETTVHTDINFFTTIWRIFIGVLAESQLYADCCKFLGLL